MIDPRLTHKRERVTKSISINPFQPEFIYRQFYKKSESNAMDPDGDPVKVAGFGKPVRIYKNEKLEGIGLIEGIPSVETKSYLKAEHDEELHFGMQFEYMGSKYKVLQPVPSIYYGGVAFIRAELRDITEGSNYAD
jgi:hypothetical protein